MQIMQLVRLCSESQESLQAFFYKLSDVWIIKVSIFQFFHTKSREGLTNLLKINITEIDPSLSQHILPTYVHNTYSSLLVYWYHIFL